MSGQNADEHFKHAVQISIEALKALLLVNAGAAAAFVALMDRSTTTANYSSAILWFGGGAVLTVIAFVLGYYSQVNFANYRLLADEDKAKAQARHRDHVSLNGAAGVFVLVAIVCSVVGMARAYQAERAATARSPYQQPSAAEAFSMRTKCNELGQKMLDSDIHGPAITVSQTSIYKPETNRCYVSLDVMPTNPNDKSVSQRVGRTVLDGQTGEALAWFNIDMKPNLQPKETCYATERSLFGIAGRASCQDINSALLEFMTEDRSHGP